jgi:hypothetical protein
MLQISISDDLAAEHPGFVAECVERGHTLEVFDEAERNGNASEGMAAGEDVEVVRAKGDGAADCCGMEP